MPTKSGKPAHYSVVIIGGGLAGLTAAWRLRQRGKTCLVIEAKDRVGGLINTESWQDCLLEHGPDAFVARKPAFSQLALELGLKTQDLLPTKHRIYLSSARGTWPLPDGQSLLVPLKTGPFLTSPLLSWSGRLRVLLERYRPARPTTTDESLAAFVRRRFGPQALRYLAEPLLGGVYNTDPEILSLAAAFPQYQAMEQRFGSVTKGMRANQSEPKPEGGGLQSLPGGIGAIIQALQTALADQLRTNTQAVTLTTDPLGYRLTDQHGQTVTAGGLILAVPAQAAGSLLTNLAPEASRSLSTIPSAGIGSISMVFKTEHLARPLDAWGLLYARDSQSPIDGLQWTTSKWAGRAPADCTIIRAFFGGFRHREMIKESDAAIVAITMKTVAPWLKPGAAAQYWSIKRWPNAFPQYAVGHVQTIATVTDLLPPTIRLAGQAFHGVGLPAVVASATQAVTGLLGQPAT